MEEHAKVFQLEQSVQVNRFYLPDWTRPFSREFLYPTPYDKRFLNPFFIDNFGDLMEETWQSVDRGEGALIVNNLDSESEKVLKSLSYYKDLLEIQEMLEEQLHQKNINNLWFNKVYSLAVIMPELIKRLRPERIKDSTKKKKPEQRLIARKASKFFLNYAIYHEVPYRFLVFLSILLVIESGEHQLKRIKDKERGEQLKRELLGMNELKVQADIILSNFYERVVVKPVIKAEFKGRIGHGHIYLSNNEAHHVELIEQDGGRCIIILGDAGSGKTIGTERFIYSAWKQGFCVLVFAIDTKGETRFWKYKMTKEGNRDMYEQLTKVQQEEPLGFKMTIWRKKVSVRGFEKNIKKFKGNIQTWNNLNNIHVFLDDHVRVLESFLRYREKDTGRDYLIVILEAQKLLRFFGKSGERWRTAASINETFFDFRGMDIPIILETRNTGLLSSESKTGISEIYSGHFHDQELQKELSKLTCKDIGDYVGDASLHKNKEFIRYCKGDISRVKFFVPPCMNQNSQYKITSKGLKRRGSR